ncbi:MAG TPA: hypothetical protein VNR38_06230 [Ureibacillus sp.]|nr:hypothetical protein [Ureibacillus sp.]
MRQDIENQQHKQNQVYQYPENQEYTQELVGGQYQQQEVRIEGNSKLSWILSSIIWIVAILSTISVLLLYV